MERHATIAVVAGGRTVEHALSLASGHALCAALRDSAWDASLLVMSEDGGFPSPESLRNFDYVLPLVHGGGLAGMLELLEVPVLGERVGGATAAIDKPLAKRVLAQAGLPVLPGLVFTRAQLAARPREVVTKIAHELGFPCFVKPASGAASIGAAPVHDLASLLAALVRAASFDPRILVEPFLDARDVEVGVIAGVPSIPGELVFRADFHDHATKTCAGALELVLPAMVGAPERDRLQAMAVAAFAALDLEAVARVEFLVDRNTHEVFLNEVNPAPCFAPTAVFPRLWEASGLVIPAIVERLARVADARQRELFRTRRGAGA